MGLLMNHLGVDSNIRVVFDAGDSKLADDDDEEEEEVEMIELSELRSLFSRPLIAQMINSHQFQASFSLKSTLSLQEQSVKL